MSNEAVTLSAILVAVINGMEIYVSGNKPTPKPALPVLEDMINALRLATQFGMTLENSLLTYYLLKNQKPPDPHMWQLEELARVTPYSFNSLVTAFENVGEGV